MSSLKVLFVCLGNICRSPAAEAIFKSYVDKNGRTKSFFIDSAGTSGFHHGELPDSRMRAHGQKRHFEINSRSRLLLREDLDNFDHIYVMDAKNLSATLSLATKENASKVEMLTDYCRKIKIDHVPDPYYGGAEGFERVFDILEDACLHLFDTLVKKIDEK